MILTPPAETMEARSKCAITYQMINLQTKKMGIAPREKIEKALENIGENVIFYTRKRIFGAVEVRFADNELMTACAILTLRMTE